MILVSNLCCGLEEGLSGLDMLSRLAEQHAVGVEVFAHTFSHHYVEQLESFAASSPEYPVRVHGPSIGVDCACEPDSPAQTALLAAFRYAFDIAKRLNSPYVTLHHNDGWIPPAGHPLLQRQWLQNLELLLEQAQNSGITLCIENFGLSNRCLPLLNQEEFVALFDRYPEARCAVSTGHLHLLGWDAGGLIAALAPKIVCYHLHNNDGSSARHTRIGDGTFDMKKFLALYRRHTPEADLCLQYRRAPGLDEQALADDIALLRKSI